MGLAVREHPNKRQSFSCQGPGLRPHTASEKYLEFTQASASTADRNEDPAQHHRQSGAGSLTASHEANPMDIQLTEETGITPRQPSAGCYAIANGLRRAPVKSLATDEGLEQKALECLCRTRPCGAATIPRKFPAVLGGGPLCDDDRDAGVRPAIWSSSRSWKTVVLGRRPDRRRSDRRRSHDAFLLPQIMAGESIWGAWPWAEGRSRAMISTTVATNRSGPARGEVYVLNGTKATVIGAPMGGQS